jgi:hypothetical protein
MSSTRAAPGHGAGRVLPPASFFDRLQAALACRGATVGRMRISLGRRSSSRVMTSGWTDLLILDLALGLLLASGCARSVAPEPRDELVGFESALVLSGGVQAAVPGSVQGRPAEIVLELADPISSVTRSCFEGTPPETRATVRYPSWRGGFLQAPEIELSGARIGQRRLGPLRAALIDGDPCRVTLGSDVLARYAVWIDPASRTLRLLASRDRAAYEAEMRSAQAGEEASLIEVERDPSSDWPMLTIRARQGRQALIGPVVLTTGSEDSVFSRASASSARIRPGPALLREIEVPPGVELPASVGGDAVELDVLELAPGISVRNAAVRTDPDWKGTAHGTLGGDVWGRFRVVLDARSGVLLLRRPRLVAGKGRQRCGAAATEEACVELHQRASAQGVELIATVWRDLPEGASVHLEVLDAQGAPLGGSCRTGFSFMRTGRGVSSAHRLPWSELSKSVPRCAQALAGANSVRFSLWQDEPVEACPGACAFVQDLEVGRVSCECHGTGAGPIGQAERRLLETYQELMRRGKREKPLSSDEPSEPGDLER